MLLNSHELLELGALLNRRNEREVLQVLLQHLPSILDQSRGATAPTISFSSIHPEVIQRLRRKLERALRELNVGVLIDECLVQRAERLVPLLDYPLLVVEVDLYCVLGVGPVVVGILRDRGLLDADAEWDLEELGAAVPVVLVAALHVLHEYLRREENLAELALHSRRMLENSRVYFNRVEFSLQLLVPGF